MVNHNIGIRPLFLLPLYAEADIRNVSNWDMAEMAEDLECIKAEITAGFFADEYRNSKTLAAAVNLMDAMLGAIRNERERRSGMVVSQVEAAFAERTQRAAERRSFAWLLYGGAS